MRHQRSELVDQGCARERLLDQVYKLNCTVNKLLRHIIFPLKVQDMQMRQNAGIWEIVGRPDDELRHVRDPVRVLVQEE